MRITLTIALALCLTGCDIFSGEPSSTVVEGVVLNAETGEPVQGLDVIFASTCSMSFCTILDWMRTDASGQFRVEYQTGDEGNWPLLRVNRDNCPDGWHCTHPYRWNDEYGGFMDRVEPGKRHELTIEVQPRPYP